MSRKVVELLLNSLQNTNWMKTKTITLKNSISSFDRYINIDENILGTSTNIWRKSTQ